MIKKLLFITLTILTAGSAYSFERRMPTQDNTVFSYFSGKVEPQKAPATRAETQEASVDYTLADQIYTASRFNDTTVGDEIFLAFEMSQEAASKFAGDAITSINIISGVRVAADGSYLNDVNDITIFIMNDIGEEPVYTQKGKLGDKGFTEYRVPLDTPYKIQDGKSFFVGYSFKIPNLNQYYIPVDYLIPETIDGSWIGVKKKGDKEVEWDNYAQKFGSICMGCTITGTNFPANSVDITYIDGPTYVQPGAEFEYRFLLKCTGLTASDIVMESIVGDGEPQYTPMTFTEPLVYNEYTIQTVKLVCNEQSLKVPLYFNVAKVNGVDNTSDWAEMDATIQCFDSSKGFPRVHVIEEGTGTWCTFCPRGIVMMEYAAKTYPDLFALVAVHASGNKVDPMEVASTQPVRTAYFGSYPSAVINRSYNLPNMTTEELDEYVMINKDVPSIMGVTDLTATILDDGKLNAETTVEVGFDTDNILGQYAVGYYLTENNVGPYIQDNGYAGNQLGPMGGWERKSSRVSTIYNDVARYLLGGVPGVAKSLPETILKPGESYTSSAQLPTSAVKDIKQCYLTAYIMDSDSGIIVNAKQIKVDNSDSGVEDINVDATPVSKKYYSISGVEVKEPTQGIYVVRTQYSDGTIRTTKEAVAK